MNYTLNQLRIFLKICQTKSVTKAAEELHLTQPAVSIQLKNLQLQFDVPITEVIGRKIYITDFGKELAEAAELIIQQAHAINYKTSAYKGQLAGKLKISIVSTGKYVMPFFLSEFLAQHPGIELIMDVTNKSKVIDSLENNEVDLALVSILPNADIYQYMNLLQNKLYFVGNKEISDKKSIKDYSVFSKNTLIFREKGSATRQAMEKFIEQKHILVAKKIELTSNEALKQALIAGMGFSIMPLIGIKSEIMNGELHIIPIKQLPIVTDWKLVWNKNKKHSPISAAFLSYLEHEKDKIVAKNFSWYEKY